jgi:hypothetical protein
VDVNGRPPEGVVAEQPTRRWELAPGLGQSRKPCAAHQGDRRQSVLIGHYRGELEAKIMYADHGKGQDDWTESFCLKMAD